MRDGERWCGEPSGLALTSRAVAPGAAGDGGAVGLAAVQAAATLPPCGWRAGWRGGSVGGGVADGGVVGVAPDHPWVPAEDVAHMLAGQHRDRPADLGLPERHDQPRVTRPVDGAEQLLEWLLPTAGGAVDHLD